MAQIPIIINLDKQWTLHCVGSNMEVLPASVPGNVHTDLINNHKIIDPYYRTNEKTLQWIDKRTWLYETSFDVDDKVLEQAVILLQCLGLDTYCDIYLNDTLIAHTDNMFRTYSFSIKPYLKEKNNSLKLYFHSPTFKALSAMNAYGLRLPADNDQSVLGGMDSLRVSPFVRKAPYHFGWDWGPRLVTSGIWKPIQIIAYNKAKINDVFFQQKKVNTQQADILTHLSIYSIVNKNALLNITDKKTGKVIAQKNITLKKGDNQISLPFSVSKPLLWWTNGLGKQHLYTWEVSLSTKNDTYDKVTKRIGLRSIKIIQKYSDDSQGTSFYVELNGIPTFIKGANHIPNDVFLNRVTPKVYDWEIIKTAKASNMNMLRVWGGGIYEDDIFYTLCDEAGILVWQDFIFACSMYPGTESFLENIKAEAIDNIKRLRNHPSLAIWCGNNEIDIAWQQYDEKGGWGWKEKYTTVQRATIWKAYNDIFKTILPQIVKQYDSGTFYMHSSPIVSTLNKHASNESIKEGDMHYWDVWHGKQKPFNAFNEVVGRFMSEYGFQSFPELVTVQKYALPEDYDIESEVMKAHQRSFIGNKAIKKYMDWYYKTPKNFEQFLYVGQVLQAEGIKTALESHRRNMPYCMGTLYWQINDCWPVASWSSTDYYRRWKALQYFTKKAFEPIILSTYKDSNSMFLTYVISDKLKNIHQVILTSRIIDFEGKEIFIKKSVVDILSNTSTLISKDNFKTINTHNKLLVNTLTKKDKKIAENIYYFDTIKNIQLPKSNMNIDIKQKNDTLFEILVNSDKLAKNLYLQTHKIDGFFSDNFFDILPQESKILLFSTKEKTSIENLLNDIFYTTILDSY
ncbi:MAG: beta-mannosidase [Chitinophagaceae bacterium]